MKKYYFYIFFSNLFFERSIFLLYLLYQGLTIGEVATYQAMINLTMLAFEVVTGIVADRIGKKVSLIMGALLMIVYHIIMLLANNYGEFLVSAIIFGIGYTFVSGTDQSYIYDLVEDRSHNTLKHLGRFSSIVTISIGVASYLGGWIQRLDWSYIFIAGIIAQLLGILILISLPNIKSVSTMKSTSEITNFTEVKAFVSLTRNNAFVRDLSLYLTINMGIVSAIYIFSQELLLNYGFDVSEVATFYAIDTVISALIFANVDKITRKYGIFIALIVSLLLLLLSFTGITLYVFLPLSLLCMSNFNNFMGTILENTFNIHIPDYARATSNSILNACSSMLMAILFFSVSILGDIFLVVFGCAGMISVILLLYMVIRHRKYFESYGR